MTTRASLPSSALFNRTEVRPSSFAAAWRELADAVAAWKPDVVVLIARKTPRLAESFRLSFGRHVDVLSDMAIPFSYPVLRHRRIAIVDDLVNVGTTLAHTAERVAMAQPCAIRKFALGSRQIVTDSDTFLLFEGCLADSEYDVLVKAVPKYLQQLNKPYDLEFPIAACELTPTSRNLELLRQRLECWEQVERIHSPSSPSQPDNLLRWSLDLRRAPHGGLSKIRLYINTDTGHVNVVPFEIPRRIEPSHGSLSKEGQEFYDQLLLLLSTRSPDLDFWDDAEPRARAWLFARSLELLVDFLDMFGDCIVLREGQLYDMESALILFGPGASALAADPCGDWRPRHFESHDVSSLSPFGRNVLAQSTDLLASVTATLGRSRNSVDLARAVAAFFDELASRVGSTGADSYSLTWPHSKEEIKSRPYLRLRIGPTFADLIAIARSLTESGKVRLEEGVPIHNQLSEVLDTLIDCGCVVPTLASYADHPTDAPSVYRIYRKGEVPDREDSLRRVRFAWHAYGKPLSITRATKIMATLAFSKHAPSVGELRAFERGTVTCFASTPLDTEPANMLTYARYTGALKRVARDR